MDNEKKAELRHRIQVLLNELAGCRDADIRYLAEVNAKLQELVEAQ